MRSRITSLMTVGAVIAIGGVSAGCGGSDDAGSTQSTTTDTETSQSTTTGGGGATSTAATDGQTLDIPADAEALAFSRTAVDAPAGTVTLKMENPSQIPHNIALQSPAIEGEVVGNGGVSEVTVDLPAGTYTYYCSVPGHLEAGMKGTLTVK